MRGGGPAGRWSAISCVLATGSLVLGACFVAIPSPTSDASADGGDAGDASAQEAGPGDSAPGDAGPAEAAVGDGGSWCAVHAADAGFCDDFDEDGLAALSQTMTGGTLQLVTTDASSPPNAMLASSTSTDPSDIYGAYPSSSATLATTATLAADLRLDAFNQENGNSAYLMDVVFNAASTSFQVGVGVDGQSQVLFVYTYDSHTSVTTIVVSAGPVFPVGQWTRVSLRASLGASGSSGTIDVTVGDATLASGVSLASTVSAGSPQLFVGLPYAAPDHGPWTVAVDNVVFDSSP